MSSYEKQLEDEVRRRKILTYDSFQLADDKNVLLPSYGSLPYAANLSSEDSANDLGATDTHNSWVQAVDAYKEEAKEHKKDPGRGMINTLEHIVMNVIFTFVICFTILILIGPIAMIETLPKSQWCPASYDSNYKDVNKYENPDHENDPCLYMRLPMLFYLTIEEADCCRRMFASVLMACAIGRERRLSDRAAGVRTMGLVSLGSCFFTISSQLAFKGSTMGWDASRVTAAIPSGVGFLGAGLIWKGTVGQGNIERHEVHGLTTAAGVWLSAAIGVGCGGGLYFVSGYTTILVTMILKYGPMINFRVGGNEKSWNGYDSQNSLHDSLDAKEKRDENEKSKEKKLAQKAAETDGPEFMLRGEGYRMALFDAKEYKLFEAWKESRSVEVDA